MTYPPFLLARQHKKARRTSGNLTLNSTSWADVDTGLDLTLSNVQVGDEIVYSLFGLVGNEAVVLLFDVVTIVSAAPVNSFQSRGAPPATGSYLPGWRGESGRITELSGTAPLYTIVAGDIDANGRVTFRLRYHTTAATNKTLYGVTATPLDVWVANIGPQDPT